MVNAELTPSDRVTKPDIFALESNPCNQWLPTHDYLDADPESLSLESGVGGIAYKGLVRFSLVLMLIQSTTDLILSLNNMKSTINITTTSNSV